MIFTETNILKNGLDAKLSYFYDLDRAVFLFSIGNFSKSLIYLEKSIKNFEQLKDFNFYFYCYNLLIQTLNELGQKDKIQQWDNSMQKFCLTHRMEPSPSTLTCYAYYNIYAEADFETAKSNLNKALKMSFDKHDTCVKTKDHAGKNKSKMEIISCLYIYSLYYYETKDYANCLQELKNLNILLNDYSEFKNQAELDASKTNNVQKQEGYHKNLTPGDNLFPSIERIKLGIQFLSALLELTHFRNYKKAEKMLWDLYETANKTYNIYFIPMILINMALCYARLNNKQQAFMFFNLAKRNINPERKLLMKYAEILTQKEKLHEINKENDYDIILDLSGHLIIEKEKGCVEFKNQFILMNLLKLFLLNPGVAFSKESIIQKVWKQEYSPEVHDNKIYVTIKRLREMIEINSFKPVYICRNSFGYYFSNSAKVLIKSKETFNQKDY